MTPTLSAVVGMWLDRPPLEVLDAAVQADRLGYPELWVGEMATFDAFALATEIAHRTERIALTVGPLAVTVRDPVMIAMGVASVAALTGRRVDVALGTSSTTVVQEWHGRSRAGAAVALAESAAAVRSLLEGERAEMAGRVVRTAGYRLRLPGPGGRLTVAAFGPRAIEVAAAHADRMVINLVPPAIAARLRETLVAEAERAGRAVPTLAVWLPTATDPTPEALGQLAAGLVPYLRAPGYDAMFTEAGFGEVVDLARGRLHPRELLAAIPPAMIETVCLVGDAGAVRARIAEYGDAGIDEVAVVPATAGDPGGARTLGALAPEVPSERQSVRGRQGTPV